MGFKVEGLGAGSIYFLDAGSCGVVWKCYSLLGNSTEGLLVS